MTREARQLRCPENVLGWIPWYADGGLSAQQKGRVEAHAAECSDCRAELDIVAGAPFEIDMDLPDPDRLFREITARIEAGERDSAAQAEVSASADRERGLADEDLDRLGRWVLDPSTAATEWSAGDEGFDGVEGAAEASENGFGMPAPAPVLKGPWTTGRSWVTAAAAALAILFLGGIGGALLSSSGSDRFARSPGTADDSIAQTSPNADSIYRSATVPSTAMASDASAGNPAPMLDVVFLDSVSLREVSEALRGVGVEIVSGPTHLGVYRVRLTRGAADGRPATAADVAAIANRLKAPGSAVAIFAEAVP